MPVDKGLIKLTISRLPDTREYRVNWFDKRYRALEKPKSIFRYNEDKSYYTDDPEDAVMTLKSTAVEARRAGYTVQVGGTASTRRLISRYSKPSEIGSLGNTTLFITSNFSSTGYPLGLVEVSN